MINLRFHIVSLVAVFLALAIGIAVGATVVDQGLVSQLNRDINGFDRQLAERAGTISSLRAKLAVRDRFVTESESRILTGRLSGVPVLFVVAPGLDESFLAPLAERFKGAGATIEGELRLTAKLGFQTAADYVSAGAALGASSTRPATIRYLLGERMVDSLVDPGATPALQSLADAGFLEYRPLDGRTGVPLDKLAPNTRVVAVSGAGTTLPDDVFLIPLLRALRAVSGARVVAVEAPTAIDAAAARPEPAFVAVVRGDAALNAGISTVDDIDDVTGRVAAVLAVEDLARGVVGHYGTAKGAARLVPGE